MAAVGTALVNALGHSDAEKAFRPWWDSLNDYLIYGLIRIGIVLVPTTIAQGTPLDCNFCSINTTNCSNGDIRDDPCFDLKWIKRFCTSTSVDFFLVYYPYFILMCASVLLFIEKIFHRMFQGGNKVNRLFNFLVKENILQKQPPQENEEKDLIDGETECEAIEMRYNFKHSTNYYFSHLSRTILEILAGLGLIVIIVYYGHQKLEGSSTIFCDVHSYHYECHGIPLEFYKYSLYATLTITVIHVLCNVYNLLWLVFAQFGKLSRMMKRYQKIVMKNTGKGTSKREALGDLYDIYYNNRDMKLLLDLQATSSGIAPALAVLTIFDKVKIR